MTDRYNAFVVILDKDIRDDDAKPIIDAIKQLRGVLSVEPQTADPLSEYTAETRLRHELFDKIAAIIYPNEWRATQGE